MGWEGRIYKKGKENWKIIYINGIFIEKIFVDREQRENYRTGVLVGRKFEIQLKMGIEKAMVQDWGSLGAEIFVTAEK